MLGHYRVQGTGDAQNVLKAEFGSTVMPSRRVRRVTTSALWMAALLLASGQSAAGNPYEKTPRGPNPPPANAGPPPANAGPRPAGNPYAKKGAARESSSSNVDLSASGLTGSWTRERVDRVEEPPNSSANFALDAMFMLGGSTKETNGMKFMTEGGGINLGIKILAGSQFPGPDGGSFHGLGLEPTFGVSGAGMHTTKNESSSSVGGGMLNLAYGGNVGYQWLSFGTMDEETLKQGGFGLFLGYHLGAQSSWTWIKMTMPQTCYAGTCAGGGSFTVSSSSTDFSHGPVISMSFPKYNAGTAHLSRAYITFMVLPTGDFIFGTVAGGYAF